MTMTGRLAALLVSLVASAGACGAAELELSLCPVKDIYAGACQGDRIGTKVLHPQRRGVKGAIPAKDYETYVYDDPVAMLQVRNLDETNRVDVGCLLGNDWFVEFAPSNKPARTGLMIVGSDKGMFARAIRPRESLCLLIGRLKADPQYEFRVGYLKGSLNGAKEIPGKWPFNFDIAYSNWLSVDALVQERREVGAQEAMPRLSLYRLENNIGNVKCDGVKKFDGKGAVGFVDMVALLENDNDSPIRFPGFGAWKVAAYDPEGQVVFSGTFHKPCTSDDVYLKAKGKLAVPLYMDMGLEEYKRLDRVRVECSSGSRRCEAEFRFAPRSRSVRAPWGPQEDGGEWVEI